MTNLDHIDKMFLTHLRKIEQNLSNVQELIENKMPTFDRPKYDKPTFDRPTFDRPTFDRPKYDKPTFDKPTFDRPKYERPIKKKRKKKSKVGIPFSNYVVDTSSSSDENSG